MYCESEEGKAYFTRLAIKYAVEDQLQELRFNFEGRVSFVSLGVHGSNTGTE